MARIAKIDAQNANQEEMAATMDNVSKLPEMVTVGLNRAVGIAFDLPGGRKLTIHGNAEQFRGMEKGILPVGQFGFTTVAKEDWDYIRTIYGNMEIFRSGLIFAANDSASAVDMADERKELRHGLEPVDTDKTATKPSDGQE